MLGQQGLAGLPPPGPQVTQGPTLVPGAPRSVHVPCTDREQRQLDLNTRPVTSNTGIGFTLSYCTKGLNIWVLI